MSSLTTCLSPSYSRILTERFHTEGVLRVCENDSDRWLDFGTEFTQSLMYKADTARLALQYTQAMTLAQAFCPKAHRMLNLGSGCGAFERFFAAHLPSLIIESVEPDVTIIKLAKEYFCLPPQHPVQINSAENHLATSDPSADLVLCDLHDGDKNPNCLSNPSFYHDVLRGMNNGGVLALNLLPTDSKDLMGVLTAVRSVFKWQYLLEFDDIRNVLIFAFAQKPANKAQIIQQSAPLAALSHIDFSGFIKRLRLLPEAHC